MLPANYGLVTPVLTHKIYENAYNVIDIFLLCFHLYAIHHVLKKCEVLFERNVKSFLTHS